MTNWIKDDRRNYSSKKVSKEKREEDEYDTLPGGLVYERLLKRSVAMKQMAYGNFEIPCSIGELKYLHALATKDRR